MRSLHNARRLPLAGVLALRLALLLALTVGLIAASELRAEVPHRKAVPAYAEEQTILQAEIDSAAPEHGRNSAASGRVHMDRHFLGQYGAGEENVILQRGGNTWRVLRNGPLATVSGAILLVAPLLILGVLAVSGPGRVDYPLTGRRLVRYTAWQRLVHWSTAISFVVMAITGLVILFGKKILLPLLGHDVFSWVAIIAKYLHNFVGPLFIVCSVLMFITFVRKNFFRPWDWQWLRHAGGVFKHERMRAGFFNAGQKLWFWGGLVLLGLLMSITGLVLDFVTVGQTRYVLQVADILHLSGATLYVAASLGHIYAGTVGTPGSYEAMRHGTVDEGWAREHHAIWYEQVRDGTADERVGPGTAVPPQPVPPGTRPGPAL